MTVCQGSFFDKWIFQIIVEETCFFDGAIRKDIAHNIESKEEKLLIVNQQCFGYSITVLFNQNLTPTSVDTCVSSSKDTVWGRKNAYEQVQNGEMGLSLIKMFFDAPNVEGKNRRQETVGLHLL